MKQRLLLLLLLTAFCVKGMSQGSDNIPVEGSKFYMENGKTRSGQTFTRGDNSNLWTFTSVVENCFDNEKKGQPAWLMTADGETKLEVTFKYNTNEERYAIESSEVEFYFYDGDDLFNDNSKRYISMWDDEIIGTFTKVDTEKSVTLHMTAPKVFPDPKISWYKFYVVLKLNFKGAGWAYVARQIGVSRNGVLLMHGLNSDNTCFRPFREYVLNTAQNYFLNQLFLQDYSSSNTSSFDTNTHVNQVVKNGFQRLCENLLRAGVASTKYDMVGHSMGGILSRLYVQEVDPKHTNRLITLNTPHFGSVLGNVYTNYILANKLIPEVRNNVKVKLFNMALDWAFSKDNSMQAVIDLGLRSSAIQKLAAGRAKMNGIPVFALGSQVKTWIDDMIALKESFYANYPKVASYLFDAKPGEGKEYLDKQMKEESDYVVSVQSQIGGCDSHAIYEGDYFEAMHCNVTKWEPILEELDRLLTVTTTDEFSTSGFGDVPGSVRTRGDDVNIELIKEIVDPKPGSFIKIEAKKVAGAKYTHELRLTNSSDLVSKVAFCLLSADDMISDYQKDVMYFDMSGFEGEKWIYAFGRTNYNALVVDSVKVTLSAADDIKSVEDNSDLCYAMWGNNLEIKNVTGPYSIAVYNSAGQMLAEMNSNPSNTYALPRNKGLLIINVRSNKGKQFLKVVTK